MVWCGCVRLDYIYTELGVVVLSSSVFIYHQSKYQFLLDSPILSHCDTVSSSLLGPSFNPEWLTIDPLKPTDTTLVHVAHQVLLWELDTCTVCRLSVASQALSMHWNLPSLEHCTLNRRSRDNLGLKENGSVEGGKDKVLFWYHCNGHLHALISCMQPHQTALCFHELLMWGPHSGCSTRILYTKW